VRSLITGVGDRRPDRGGQARAELDPVKLEQNSRRIAHALNTILSK
jgi:hypothetical protein